MTLFKLLHGEALVNLEIAGGGRLHGALLAFCLPREKQGVGVYFGFYSTCTAKY